MPRILSITITLITDAVGGFFDDDGMSHSAAIAFYAITSLGPILLIVVAIAGLGFGNDAAQVALAAQISGLMGPQSADLLKSALQSASEKPSGTLATLIGFATLFVTASGVFGEMQLSLNKIWKVEPKSVSLSRLVRARAASLGLVAALGFLLLISLVASAATAALADMINAALPFGSILLGLINASVSFGLIALLFAAIYKVLPDRALEWRDVIFGAIVTAALFTVGKSLIGLYLGSTAIASSYGAAGGLLIALLWVFYSSVIFLVGAEITRSYSVRYGSRTIIGVHPITATAAIEAEPQPGSERHSALFPSLVAIVYIGAALSCLRAKDESVAD